MMDPKDKNEKESRIGPNGMYRLLKDLKLSETDRLVLLLCWKLGAQVQCEFSKLEFIEGLKMMRQASNIY